MLVCEEVHSHGSLLLSLFLHWPKSTRGYTPKGATDATHYTITLRLTEYPVQAAGRYVDLSIAESSLLSRIVQIRHLALLSLSLSHRMPRSLTLPYHLVGFPREQNKRGFRISLPFALARGHVPARAYSHLGDRRLGASF